MINLLDMGYEKIEKGSNLSHQKNMFLPISKRPIRFLIKMLSQLYREKDPTHCKLQWMDLIHSRLNYSKFSIGLILFLRINRFPKVIHFILSSIWTCVLHFNLYYGYYNFLCSVSFDEMELPNRSTTAYSKLCLYFVGK